MTIMKKRYILFASALVLAAACEKVPSASDFDGEFLVYTAHSEEAGDFARFETFTVADSLLAIDGDRGSMFLNDWAKSVRNQYIEEMEAKGYRYVDTGKVDSDLDQDVAPEARADLGIQISYIVSTSYYTAYYPSYPWWLDYPGYWYPGYWGGWGSWYYSFPVTYGYSTHSLLTEMVDLTGETGDDKPLPVIWNSYIDGSIGGSRADAARFSRAVSQSFAQSEYLGK